MSKINHLEMNPSQLVSLLDQSLGSRWKQVHAAAALGVSQAQVSLMLRGKAPIKPQVALKAMHLAKDTPQGNAPEALEDEVIFVETDAQVRHRLREKFSAMKALVRGVVDGHLPGLVVSGGAGSGKSHTVLEAIGSCPFRMIKGACSAPGLYEAAWEQRDGGLIVIDDCDEIFGDEDTLNILKGLLDSTEERFVCWNKQARWLKEKEIDREFYFEGSIIFITNKDLETISTSKSQAAPHVEALLDRCGHICLDMFCRRDILIRIEDLAPELLADLDEEERQEVLGFIRDNAEGFRRLSLREVVKVKRYYRLPNWEKLIRHSLMA